MAARTFTLTEDYILRAFKPLEEIQDLDKRNVFFQDFMVDDVIWELAGTSHALAGTSYSLAEHNAATFNKLGKKLVNPIKFTVKSIILDADAKKACVETQGEATRKTGEPYNNEYIWLTTWNDEGKIVHVRSYFDTLLAQQTLDDP